MFKTVRGTGPLSAGNKTRHFSAGRCACARHRRMRRGHTVWALKELVMDRPDDNPVKRALDPLFRECIQ